MLADNLNLASGVDIALDSGPYNPQKFSVSTGHSSVIPVVSLRYDQPLGPDVAVSNRLLFNQRNDATKYKSGTVYTLDFQAGWNFTQKLKLGAVGGFFSQISDDNAPFGVQNGNRSEYLAVGPSATYETEVFGRPININLNYQRGVYARNTTKSSTAWLNVAIPLYVPGRPPTADKPVQSP